MSTILFSVVVIAISACVLLASNCLAENVEPANVQQIKEILKDVHGYPKKVLTVLEEVEKVGEVAESALISIFKDERRENYRWRMEPAILLTGIKSDKGVELVREFMYQVVKAASIEDMRKMKHAIRNELNIVVVWEAREYFSEIMIGLGDIALYKKLLCTQWPEPYVAGALIKKKPAEVMPIVIDAIEGKKFDGQHTNWSWSYRAGLARVIVKEQDCLDEEAKVKARTAIEKLALEYQDEYSRKILDTLLKELK